MLFFAMLTATSAFRIGLVADKLIEMLPKPKNERHAGAVNFSVSQTILIDVIKNGKKLDGHKIEGMERETMCHCDGATHADVTPGWFGIDGCKIKECRPGGKWKVLIDPPCNDAQFKTIGCRHPTSNLAGEGKTTRYYDLECECTKVGWACYDPEH